MKLNIIIIIIISFFLRCGNNDSNLKNTKQDTVIKEFWNEKRAVKNYKIYLSNNLLKFENKKITIDSLNVFLENIINSCYETKSNDFVINLKITHKLNAKNLERLFLVDSIIKYSYNKFWNYKSIKLYHISFDSLNNIQRNKIVKKYPAYIYEDNLNSVF